MWRGKYPALVVSSEEERVACNLTHPLKDFVDCVLFRLDSCFTELRGVQTFRGKFKLKLTLFFGKEEDTKARIMEDTIRPSLRSITGDFEADTVMIAQIGLGAVEVRNDGHVVVCR